MSNTELIGVGDSEGCSIEIIDSPHGSIEIDVSKYEAIVQDLVQQTVNVLTASTDPVVTSFDLKQRLKKHFDNALKEFSDAFGSADTNEHGKYKGLLISELKRVFRSHCRDFQNRITRNMGAAVVAFRSQVESELMSHCFPAEKFEEQIGNIKAVVLSKFDGDLFRDQLDELRNLLEEETLNFMSENNNRLSEMYLRFNGILNDLLETYSDMIEMFLPDDELETASEQKILNVFEKCEKRLIRKLNKEMTFDNSAIQEMFESRLKSTLQEQLSVKVNMAMDQKNRRNLEAECVVTTAISDFTKYMLSKIGETSYNSVLHRDQKVKAKEIISSITNQIYEILGDPTAAKLKLKAAQQRMESIFEEMKNERQLKLEEFKQQWDTEMSRITEEFLNRMSEFSELLMLPDLQELKSKRATLIDDSISNASWIKGHRDESNLLARFREEAENAMFTCSTPIFEAHQKLLDDISEQHKDRMNDCLGNYKMRMDNLIKEDIHNDITTRAKSIGASTVRQFAMDCKQMSPTCATIAAQFVDQLKQEISTREDQFQNQFQNQIRDHKLLAKAEIAQIIERTISDYAFLMKAFSIASSYNKDKITQIHADLTERARYSLQKELKLAKYAGELEEAQRDFEAKIANLFSSTLCTVDAQQKEWNERLKSCNQKMNNFYHQQFTSLMGNVPKEDELQRLHADLKQQTLDQWEQEFPIDCCADKFLPERRGFLAKLGDDFKTTILEKWHQVNLDIDRNAKRAIDTIVKDYEREMTSDLKIYAFVSDEMISMTHKRLSEKAIVDLKKINKPENVGENTYTYLLQSHMGNTFECVKTQNTQMKIEVENAFSNEIRRLQTEFSGNVLNSNVFPEMSAFIPKYQDALQSMLHKYNLPGDCLEEFQQFSHAKLQLALKEVEEKWDQNQPDSNELQLCINRAVDEYNKEMGNRTLKKGQVFVASAMKTYHKQALAVVLQNFQRSVRQTSAVREKFNSAIDEVFNKFQQLNNINAADCYDAAIGIDLGTTFSCVAIYKGGKIEMIPDREHHSTTIPSYVFYESATKTVVGHAAKDQSVIHPQETIFDSKRLIGRKFDDTETQKDIKQWPFRVVRDPNTLRHQFPKIEVHNQTLYPEEVSGEVLKHLKSNAELHLDRKVKDVVITVPAYFNDAQKQATKAAAAFANLNVLEILAEPTSAAISYSLNYTDGKRRNILVFDLGGGTFDVSVLTSEKCNINVKAVGGDNHLGGEDFDSNMVDFCIEQFRKETGLEIPKNTSLNIAETADTADDDEVLANQDKIRKTFERLRRLRQKCEQAKIILSKADKARVVIDYIYEQHNLDVEVTVQDFVKMNESLFDKCLKVVEATLLESKLSKNDIEDVVLVGGSSRIPEVQKRLTNFFDGKSLIMTLNPDEVVAQGAAYRAAMLSGSKSSELKGIKFKNVNPLSLGINVVGGRFSVIIPKNTPLPVTRTETYVTIKNYQTEMDILVYEGENPINENNNLLGKFRLTGIPSKRRGEEPVDVTLECNNEGILHVTAKVRSNDSSGNITIDSNRGNLTEEDIQMAKSRNAQQSSAE